MQPDGIKLANFVWLMKAAILHQEEEKYDPKKRDPRHADAEHTSAFEVVLLLQHFHPSVSRLVQELISPDFEFKR